MQFLMTVGSGWGRTLEEAIVHFWMPREAGVSTHCVVLSCKGNNLRVVEAECAVS